MSLKIEWQAFLLALQFLSRIHLTNYGEWTSARIGRSVRYFPLVGAIIGGILALVARGLETHLSAHLITLLLVLGSIYLTGGLHCDGFMDTMDGLLSGRKPERILEIMKDSRVGSNGVVLFVGLFALKWAFLEETSPLLLPLTLFLGAVTARLAMVFAVTQFPYARPEGIGKAFAEQAGPRTWLAALGLTVLLVSPLLHGYFLIIPILMVTLGLTYLFCRSVARRLGGLTGDLYGCVTEMAELCVYILMFCLGKWLL